ncbi:MAG: aspartate aminotransferase family protein [Bryobacterales bacterium]
MDERWRKSRELLQRARGSLAGGVSSPFRAKFPVPLFFEDGEGSRLTDVDGNGYIDYALAWGPLILGHKHPRMVEAVAAAAQKPHTYGAQHELEYAVAEKVQAMVPCAERVAVTSAGSEAVQLAMRLARAATGRTKILKFEGHYHGWIDSALISYHPSREACGPADAPNAVLPSRGQVANAADNVAIARWNSADALAQTLERHAGEIAAVILEPVLCNSGCLMPREGYLESVAKLAREAGALLIFDEVITGLRMAPGGAQQAFGVVPDLATLGKALGGGVPISAVVGRKDLIELIVDGGVAFGGTFNGNPLSMAGANAALDVLGENDGAALAAANRRGEKLRDGLAERAAAHGIPCRTTGFGCAFSVHFTERAELREYRDTLDDDGELLRKFLTAALEQGIYILADGRFYVSTAHTDADIDETLEALDRALATLA